MRDILLHPRARPAAALLLALCLTVPAGSPAQARTAANAPVSIDWPTFLRRHDLVWDRLPRDWGESVFIGNGLVGATIDGAGDMLGWTINRTDVTHDQSRFPIGRLTLKTAGALKGGTARLTLWDGEASGVAITDSGEVRWRSFVARAPSVIVAGSSVRGVNLDSIETGTNGPEAMIRLRYPRPIAHNVTQADVRGVFDCSSRRVQRFLMNELTATGEIMARSDQGEPMEAVTATANTPMGQVLDLVCATATG